MPPRRLHVVLRQYRHHRHQSEFLSEFESQAGARFRADLARVGHAGHLHRAAGFPGEFAARDGGLREGASGQGQLRGGRYQHAQYPGDGAVREARRAEDDAGAVQRRRRTGHCRSDGRTCRPDVRDVFVGCAIRTGGETEGVRGHDREAAQFDAECADRCGAWVSGKRFIVLARPVRDRRHAAADRRQAARRRRACARRSEGARAHGRGRHAAEPERVAGGIQGLHRGGNREVGKIVQDVGAKAE